jgi:capsular polysaccharide biosynthesis protein
MLQKYSFECIDADRLTIEQQIRIFSEAAFVVGIHGAGLTNMIFRYPYQMNVLEILPDAPERFAIPPHYFLLSGIFGFQYNAVMGSTYVKKLNKSFTMNAAELELALQTMLGKAGFD